MSSVFKLAIKGIRLFEPEQEETIQFGFPLTLICGQNGTGKTTIIECLKYATTGFLPPNSKGGAFVNDPSLSGRNNVTGQVKLAFQNANGKSMLLTRTVQLSRRKAKTGGFANTFKTLEGQLAIIDQGNKISISSKNAELDSQTPIYLGASPAILEYVIFCHQEDSLWPLSEASVLKKRFDDIFEASKFTKVLDNLKLIKKDMTTDIKLLEQSVTHLLTDKTRAKKIRQRVEELKNNMETFTTEIADINIKIEQYEHEAENLFASNQEFQRILSDYERFTYTKKSLQDQMNRLKNSIDILHESDEELIRMQDSFSDIANKKNSVDELTKLHDEMSLQLDKYQESLNVLIREEALLTSKEADYKEHVDQLYKLIQTNANEVGFSMVSSKEGNFVEFEPFIKQYFTTEQLKHDKIVESITTSDVEATKVIQEINDSITRESQHHKYLVKDIATNKDRLASFQKKLELSDIRTEVEEKKEALNEVIAKLEEKKSLQEVKALDVSIDENKSAILKLEIEVDELLKKMTISNKQSDIRTKIDLLNESILTKQKSVDKLNTNWKPLFVKVVDPIFDDSCEIKLNEKISNSVIDVKGLEKSLEGLSSEANSLKAEMESVSKSIAQNNSISVDSKSKITSVIEEEEIADYESILAELEDSYANVMDDVNTSEVTRQFNITAISIAEKNHNCLLCKRTFDGDGLSKFLEALKSSINQDKVMETESKAKEIKQELDSVKGIINDVLKYRSSVQSLQELQKKHLELEGTLCNKTKDVDELKSQIMVKKELIETLNDLKKPLSDVTRLNQEIFDIQVQVDELKDELDDFGTVSLSINEIQSLQNQKNQVIKALREQVSKDSDSKYTVQREISRMESKVKDTKLAISNMEVSLADVNNIKSSINELTRSLESLDTEEKEVLEHLKTLTAEQEKQTKILEDLQLQNSIKKLEASKKLKVVKELYENYQELYLSIKSFEENDKSNLEDNYKQTQEILSSREELNQKVMENSMEIKKLEKEIADASKIEQNIVSNIDYRGLIKELEKVGNEISALDIDNAQIRKEEYHEKSRNLRQTISDLNSSHAGKIGEMKQIKDQIATMQKELDSEYKNVDNTYHEEWIKLQTNMLVSNDIQTYSKALDNAIMKYHSIKMEEINRILRELWSQTYKGSDIETIAIKSDVNVQAKGNRSYNYRVVMYKSGNELDMRGRCSAGQKVLTSILIRLALAECFGINCGIIALDEPTTNLDTDNTESLAEALNQIIEFRKSQSNFQLIVITHDETFLTHINGGNFTDHFYRVQRDESQNSRIYRLPMSKIR
jgi:DNA repair protein RAD50